MAETIRAERRMRTAAGFEAVVATRHPQLCKLAKGDLVALAGRIRDHGDTARDVSRQRQRRHEQRGKAKPRGAGPAPSEIGRSSRFVKASRASRGR